MTHAAVAPATPTDDQLERIQQLLVETLQIDVPSVDTDLIETGLLDSLALVNLILELESAFDITISYEALEIDHFRTVRSIDAFISDMKASEG